MSRLDEIRELRVMIESAQTSRRESEVVYIDGFLASIATLVERQGDEQLMRALREAVDQLGWLEPGVIESADSYTRIVGVCRVAEVALRHCAATSCLG